MTDMSNLMCAGFYSFFGKQAVLPGRWQNNITPPMAICIVR